MGDESLKDFTINWMLGGFLIACLLFFSITFVYNNNADALNDGTSEIIGVSSTNISNELYELSDESNELLNVTSNTNPELSELGDRASVAVGFSAKGSGTSYWESSKSLLSWVFSGTSGKMLLGVIGGMIGFLSLFFLWRFIRTGG